MAKKNFFHFRLGNLLFLFLVILLFSFTTITEAKECDYYGTITIENPNTPQLNVIDPCRYTQTITINDENCEKISGDFDDYKITNVPQCRAMQHAILEGIELFFPERSILEKEEKETTEEKATGTCEIIDAWWEKTSILKGNRVRMFYEKSKECDEESIKIEYTVYLRRSWYYLFWRNKKILTTSQNIWVPREPGTYYFDVDIYKSGNHIAHKKSNYLEVSDCLDDALLLCQSGEKDSIIYGVSNASRYKIISSLSSEKDNTIKYWIIDMEKYSDIDFKKCDEFDKGRNFEKYTYVDDGKYVKYVKNRFGEEPFFKKYREMYDEKYVAYLYCYKTELKDMKGCREGINHDWYSMQDKFQPLLTELIYPEYIEEVKKWNLYQDVDDALSKETLIGEEYKEGSELIKNSWTKIFTLTPKLHDNKNNKNWTKTGNGTVYVGTGFENYDACKFSCDAKNKNDAFEGCSKFREDDAPDCGGIGINDCSDCYLLPGQTDKCEEGSAPCTKSGSDCGDPTNDCGKICKVDAYYSDDGMSAETKFKIPNVKIFGVAETKNQEALKTGTCLDYANSCSFCVQNGCYWCGISIAKCYDSISACEKACGAFSCSSTLKECVAEEDKTKTTNLEVQEKSGNVKIIKHPAFNITERGNLNFKIEDATLTVSGDTYTIKRVYKPDDKKRKFIVDSDIVFNYDLLESAENLKIDVEHKYKTKILRDIYKVTCEHPCCDAECKLHDHNVKGCDKDSTEEKEDEKIVKDTIEIEKVHKSKITDTAEVSITGVIDKFVNEFDEVEVSGEMNITLNLDILGSFLLETKDAGISYKDLIYPIKHLLLKKKSSSPKIGAESKQYLYESRYGYEDKEFNFPEQCKKVCPSDPSCKCPIDNPLKPTCVEFEIGSESSTNPSKTERTDCACLPSDCYSNPCISNRTYHEEEGSRIVNGDFEQELEPFWKISSGEASRELGGYSGFMLKLNGKLSQEISPAVSSQPYGELCLEFGIKEAKEFKVILIDSDKIIEHSICSGGGDECSKAIGWMKKCFPVKGNLSKVELISDGEVFIDNINLGKFYDFINFQTYNTSQIEFMDRTLKAWESTGLFSTGGITHERNSYIFDVEILSRKFMHPKTGEFLIYTLSDSDILNTTITLYTFFKNETFSLFPERREKNLYINVTLRNASKLIMEYFPKGYGVSYGTKVTVKLNLSFFFTGEPIANEKIYLDFLDENIFDLSPDNNLKKEMIGGEEQIYVKTNEDGLATFSFVPKRKTTIYGVFLGNQRASPTFATLDILVIGVESPFLSMQFLILLFIFYIALFSYRFFKPRRIDLYHWWEEFKGRKL